MPVNIPKALPARRVLEDENVFVMTEDRAEHQDIRPLRIAILNLMPTKIATETHLLRLLGNSPLQVEVTLLHMETHASRNTPPEHLESFYTPFERVCDQRFDGLVVTGAPVEKLEFEQVDYWDELLQILDWSSENVYSTMHVCWGAQAGLYHHYGVPKYELDEKMFGIFSHDVLEPTAPILSGFDEVFPAPHSRHTEVRQADIEAVPDLRVLAASPEAGVYLAASTDNRRIYVTGHPEYEHDTLKLEYDRDISRGLQIDVPRGYYPGDDPTQRPRVTWRSHAFLLYSNWLNHCVYQGTPFDLEATSPTPTDGSWVQI